MSVLVRACVVRILGVVACAGLVSAGCGVASASDVVSVPRTSWIVARSAIDLVDGAGGTALTAAAFDNPGTHEIGQVAAGWTSLRTTTLASYAAFAGQAATLSAGSWVMYDNEHWSFTPVAEQTDPAGYMARFVTLAHQHQLRVILTPALDLAIAMNCDVRTDPAWRNYLDNCRLPAAAAAAHPDAFEIQAQSPLPAVRPRRRTHRRDRLPAPAGLPTLTTRTNARMGCSGRPA